MFIYVCIFKQLLNGINNVRENEDMNVERERERGKEKKIPDKDNGK